MKKHIVKLLIGMSMALTLTLVHPQLTPQGIVWSSPSPIFACGLGQTATMLANNQPALAYPSTPSQPPDQPMGIFPLDYLVNTAINLDEDLSKVASLQDPSLYQFDWDFGDGGDHGSSLKATHTYATPGTYAIRLNITDNSNGETDEIDSAEIHIVAQTIDQAPVAKASGTDQFAQVGGTITYSASGSHAMVGSDLTYTWNFGDASVATGATVQHTFSLVGQGNVTLIVQDKRGAKAVAYVPLTVALELPKGAITASATSGKLNQAITFDASGSKPPASAQGDAIAKYSWNFGDGATITTTTPTVTHKFTKGGTFSVIVNAIDNNGLPGKASVRVLIDDGGLLGVLQRLKIPLWAIAAILLAFFAAGLGNWARYRQEHKRQLARAAARERRLSRQESRWR